MPSHRTQESGRALAGLTVAVTRPGAGSSADRLSRLIRALGGRPEAFPLTRILPPEETAGLARGAREMEVYDWVVVSSRRAVDPLVDALERAERTPADLPALGVRVCAVGPRTAEALRDAGFRVDLVPAGQFSAEGLVDAMREGEDLSGARVLFPRAEGGREVIPRELERSGAQVDVTTAYRSAPDPEQARRLREAVRDGEVDVLTFTAGSAAAVFLDSGDGGPAEAPRVPGTVGVFALGPATASALRLRGVRVDRIAQPHTFEGLVAAMELWRRRAREDGQS